MSILALIIVGSIAGYLAKRVRGEGPHGLFGDLAVGVIGAFVGGWIFYYFSHPGVTSLNIGSILVAFVGSVVFLWGVRVLTRSGARI